MRESNIKIIAEIGVNHNGSIRIAKKLIDKVKSAGADFVKFQFFNSKDLTTVYAHKANYQKISGKKNEMQYEMLKKYELSFNQIKLLKKYCKKKN